MNVIQYKQMHIYMCRGWNKLYLGGYGVIRYVMTLVKKRRFSDAREAASTLNVLLCFFDDQGLEQEIKKCSQFFAYLLEPSSLYLQGRPCTHFASDVTLHESWIYALDHEETQRLSKLYQKLGEVNKTLGQTLQQWMNYLERMHLERMDIQQETVRLSPEVRRRYDNTKGLADGVEVEIELHPWLLGPDLIVSGMIKR